MTEEACTKRYSSVHQSGLRNDQRLYMEIRNSAYDAFFFAEQHGWCEGEFIQKTCQAFRCHEGNGGSIGGKPH